MLSSGAVRQAHTQAVRYAPAVNNLFLLEAGQSGSVNMRVRGDGCAVGLLVSAVPDETHSTSMQPEMHTLRWCQDPHVTPPLSFAAHLTRSVRR